MRQIFLPLLLVSPLHESGTQLSLGSDTYHSDGGCAEASVEDGESVQNEERIYLQDVTAAEQEDREAVSGSRVEGDT